MGLEKEVRLSDGFYSVNEAAALLGVNRQTFQSRVNSGVFPVAKHRWRDSIRHYYTVADIERIKAINKKLTKLKQLTEEIRGVK